jgi:hypothetical protein
MNKELAKKIVKENLIFNNLTNVSISKEEMYINSVFDAMGNKIFYSYNNDKGWLIFINPCNMANWSHKCMYWFITDEKIIKNDDCHWFPEIDMEEFK